MFIQDRLKNIPYLNLGYRYSIFSNKYDIGEKFFDYGIDGLPDYLEPGYNQDPNNDNYDVFIMNIDGIPAYVIKTAQRPQITFDEVTLEHMNVTRYVLRNGCVRKLAFEEFTTVGAQFS